jgi:hypothetical protein
MMELIFYNEKKIVLVIKNLETEQNNLKQSRVFCEKRYIIFATWFRFSIDKKQKNITKLNSLPTKYFKKSTKIILEGKKLTRKNVVAIDNVLWGKLQCFPQYNRQRQF